MTLNATPLLMHSFSTQQLNSYYLQEDSTKRYLAELKMFFFFLNSFFIWLSICFCLVVLLCYLLFVLISQVFVIFTSGFVGCYFCCNPFFIFLAFELVQYVNVLSVQIEKRICKIKSFLLSESI